MEEQEQLVYGDSKPKQLDPARPSTNVRDVGSHSFMGPERIKRAIPSVVVHRKYVAEGSRPVNCLVGMGKASESPR